MLFHSYEFVFIFLPLCIVGYYMTMIAQRRHYGTSTKAFLTVMSLISLLYASLISLLVMTIGMLVNYGIYIRMGKTADKRPWLVTGLGINLGMLGLFKYVGVFGVPLGALGISFYTFSQIAFLMERYRGNLGQMTPGEYSTYLTFFPKLIQGPIMLPGEMSEQLRKEKEKQIDYEGIYRGLVLFVLGLGKKVLLADTLGSAADYGYANLALLHTGDALIVMLSYTLQIYFDFSGYCDMAMGAARMLGFWIPLNFNSPYKAGSILEFWKRWHMTLTRFFTKYLYIPLGGNRKGEMRSYLNIMIVFLVSGIWHGAGLTFLVWGAMHGILYVINKWVVSRQKEEKQWGKMKHILQVAATFLFVNAAWVFFRAPSLQEAILLFEKIFAFDFARINWNLAGYFNMDEFWYVIKVLHIDRWQYGHYILMVLMLFVALLIVFFGKKAVDIAENIKPGVWSTFALAVLFVWCVVSFSRVSSFIYVNF